MGDQTVACQCYLQRFTETHGFHGIGDKPVQLTSWIDENQGFAPSSHFAEQGSRFANIQQSEIAGASLSNRAIVRIPDWATCYEFEGCSAWENSIGLCPRSLTSQFNETTLRILCCAFATVLRRTYAKPTPSPIACSPA